MSLASWGIEPLSWLEISRGALEANARAFKQRVGQEVRLGIVVKSDAYGHGLISASRAFLRGGADWLIINAIAEGIALREAGIDAPLYLVGPTPVSAVRALVHLRIAVVAYEREFIDALEVAASTAGLQAQVFLKVETGNHRQGLELPDVLELARYIRTRAPHLEILGAATHYADIEDTTDPRFAMGQHQSLEEAVSALRSEGFEVPITTSANSAATLLWPKTHGGLVRVGVSAYGFWPSGETYTAALLLPEQRAGLGGFLPELRPALAWKARLAQVKTVPTGGWVGYGRTYRCTHPTRIGIVPVGYHEGYDRGLSNLAHTLVDGVRAPVRGRVCMNMTLIDVSDQPQAKAGTVVTLIGRDGDEQVSAGDLARWAHTIHYEVLSRLHPSLPRMEVE